MPQRNSHQAQAEGITRATVSGHEVRDRPASELQRIEFAALHEMVRSWPNSGGAIAKAIGAQAQALQSLAGLESLESEIFDRLLNLLGYSESCEQGGCFPAGPCVLIARGTEEIVECYDALSGDGDVEGAFEVLPKTGVADPSFRYLLLKRSDDRPSVIMIPRGHPVTDGLHKHFINCDAKPRRVDPEFYRELQRACSMACVEPGANVEEMRAWGRRCEDEIDQLFPQRYAGGVVLR